MFSKQDNASKIAMLYLIARLKQGGFSVLDTQFCSEHLAQFGVREIPDSDYQKILAAKLGDKTDFNSAPDYLSTTTVLQSITQVMQFIVYVEYNVVDPGFASTRGLLCTSQDNIAKNCINTYFEWLLL